jgi:putative effector of murein hydrolase
MEVIINSFLFGIILTFFVSFLSKRLKKVLHYWWYNPMITSTLVIILILLFFDIPFEYYNKGGKIINMFLGPITVLLAVPLYKNWIYLRKHSRAIVLGIIVGSVNAIASVYLLSVFFGLDDVLMKSILGRSVTTPIGIALTQMLEANSSIVVVSIMVSGISSVMMSDLIFKILKIKHPVSKGIALGTTSHAIGTAKAMEYGNVEGAMSALSIGIAGVFTIVFVAAIQLFVTFLNLSV